MNIALKSYKKDFEHSYAFGVFPTLELLRYQAEYTLGVLVSSKGERNEGVRKIWEMCHSRRVDVQVNDKAVERLAPMENAYAVGVFEKYQAPLRNDKNHVVLVNPSDMGNLGTIIRTMVGFGVTDLAMVRPAVDLFDPKVVRASMGALFQTAFEYFDSFEEYRRGLPHSIYPFITHGDVPSYAAEFTSPYTLVFGNESAGLPQEYRTIGTSVTIPHSNSIDSLNLTLAVGIALYEATKNDFNSRK